MVILTDTFIPYEFDVKQEGLRYIESRCQGLKKSLRLLEKTNEHLIVRCPLSGDYLTIVGSIFELDWLDNELRRRQWYRTN